MPLAGGHRGRCSMHTACEIHVRGYCKTQLRMSSASFLLSNEKRAPGYCRIVAASWANTCQTDILFRDVCLGKPVPGLQMLSAPVVERKKPNDQEGTPETAALSDEPDWLSEVRSPSPPPPQSGLACSSDAAFHQSETNVACVLAATAMSSSDPRLDWLETRLEENCKSYGGWLHFLLNYHDGGGTTSSLATRFSASCIATTQWRGFKTLFWKHALQPAVLRRYTHVWLFDSDLDVSPSAFALPTMLRIMQKINVSSTGLEPR